MRFWWSGSRRRRVRRERRRVRRERGGTRAVRASERAREWRRAWFRRVASRIEVSERAKIRG